ncbi:MAG: hypothetical protein IKE70_01390 [Bacilli bacterium]|nr:hypothetical protein [Bacilli bacterium]
MGYKLDTKNIDISGKRISKLASEKTGDIYRYKDMALRIFKQENPAPIDLETTKILKDIPTERILLPKNILFYNNSFRGFTYKLVNNRGRGQKIMNLEKEDFLDEVSILEKDIERLSSRQILLNGIEPKNTIFNGELYITDPTKFRRLELMSTMELEELNKYQLNLLLTTLITSEVRKSNFDSRYEKRIKEELLNRDEFDTLATFYADVIGEHETIKKKVKSMNI